MQENINNALNTTGEKMEVSADNKKLARFLAGALGFEPHVYTYWDEDNKNCLDILSITDPIDSNVKFYSTIGLSDYQNLIKMNDNSEKNIPIELLMAGYKNFEQVSNILSTCGFYISKNKWNCKPNNVFESMVAMYYPQKEVKHILFCRPFLWEDKLGDGLELENKTAHFLLCIPITERELEFKMKNGTNALSDLFEKNEVNIFDLDRKSVV